MNNSLACPKCSYERKSSDTTSLSECPNCGLVFSTYTPKALASADRRLVMRQVFGSCFGMFALGSLGMFVLLVSLFFSNRGSNYTLPIIAIATVTFASTVANTFSAYRLFSKGGGKSLWPLSILGSAATLGVLVFIMLLGAHGH